MAGFDPSLQNQALQTLGSQYRVPVPGGMPGGAVDTIGQLSPDEIAFAQQAQASDQQNATQLNAVDGGSWGNTQPMPPAANLSSIPLEWQPEAAQGGAAAQQQSPMQGINPYAQQQQSMQPMGGRGAGGVGLPVSPFGGLQKEAGMRRLDSSLAEQDATAGVDQAAADRAAAMRQQGAAKQETANAAAGVYDRLGAKQQQDAQALQAQYDGHQKALGEAQAKIAADYDFIDKHSEVKDRRTTGQRALAAVAIGIGSFASDMLNYLGGNSRNLAKDVIDQNIERDLNEQREMLANKKTTVAGKESLYGKMMAQFGDERQATMAYQAASQQQYMSQLEAEKARGMGKEGLAVTDQLIGELKQSVDEKKQALAAGRADRAIQDQQQLAAQDAQFGLQRAQLAISRDAADAKASKGAPMQVGQDTPMGRKVARPDVFGQLAPAEHGKLLESENNTRDLNGAIESLKQLRAEHPVMVGVPWTGDYNTANSLMKDIQLALKEQKKLGTWDNGSEKVLNAMTGDPNAWFINTPGAQLDALAVNARRAQAKAAQAAGLEVTPDELKLIHKTRTGAAK